MKEKVPELTISALKREGGKGKHIGAVNIFSLDKGRGRKGEGRMFWQKTLIKLLSGENTRHGLKRGKKHTCKGRSGDKKEGMLCWTLQV